MRGDSLSKTEIRVELKDEETEGLCDAVEENHAISIQMTLSS